MPLAISVAKAKGAILLARGSYNPEFSTKQSFMEFLDNVAADAIKKREEIQKQLEKRKGKAYV